MIDIFSCKFTNDFCTTGSNSLVGGLGSRQTVDIEFYVHWEVLAKDLTFYGNQIIRNDGGNWINDGFRLGQTIYVEYVGTSTAINYGEFEIANISTDILTLTEVTNSDSHSDLVNGTLPFTTEIGTFDFNVHGTTKIKNINFYFGLVENSQSTNYVSLLDGEIQKYTKNGLDTDDGNTYTLDIANSNKSWITGTATDITNTTIEELGTGYTEVSTGFEQAFKITLPFFLVPTFLESFVDTNDELSGNLFPELAGANSLKFTYKIEAGTDNTSVIFYTDNGNISAFTNNGSVGFYDQYRNTATAPEYSIDSVTYLDPNGNTVDELIKNATTSVELNLYSTSGKFVAGQTRVIVTVYEVPEDFADVQNNTSTLFTNFDVSYVNVLEGAAATDNNNIDNLEVNFVDANNLSIIFDYLPPNATKQYLIVVETADYDELDLSLSDGNTMLADYNSFQYQVDLTEIYTSPNGILVNEHSSNDENRTFTDYKGWIEDGVLFTNQFRIYTTGGYSDELTNSLRSATVKIEVVNSLDSSRNFTLEEFTLLPPNQNTGRTFQLPTGDPKNYLSITEDTVTVAYTAYTIKYATKLRWETWFTQANADPDFSPATKDWHEYFVSGEWSVKMNMYFDISSVDTDDNEYNFEVVHGTDVGIKDYDEYDGCEITATIETFHEPTMTDLDGSLSRTANTFVRATFYGKKLFPCIWNPSSECDYSQIISGSGSGSDSNGEIFALGCPELYGILELDDLSNGGQTFIRQISTMYDPETDTPWIGESGVRAKITLYPYATNPCAVVEAVLDIEQLDLSRNYKLSARIGEVAGTICSVAITYVTDNLNFESYTNTDINGYLENDLLIFTDGLNADSQGEIITYSAPTITFKNPKDGIRICCASDSRIDGVKADPSYTNATLIGLSEDDFLFFTANGREATTTNSGYTFDTVTGTMTYTGNNGNIIVDFKEAIFSDNIVTPVMSYTHASLQGLTMQDILVFNNGFEGSSFGLVSLLGDTLYFGTMISGKLKVCRVNG